MGVTSDQKRLQRESHLTRSDFAASGNWLQRESHLTRSDFAASGNWLQRESYLNRSGSEGTASGKSGE